MTWSIRARLTLWYSALMAAALTLFSVGVLVVHTRWGQSDFDTQLGGLADATSRMMHEELEERDNLSEAVSEVRDSIDVPGRATAILDASGRPLAAHWRGFTFTATSATTAGLPPRRISTVESGGQAWRLLLQRESSSAGDYVILVAGTLDPLVRQQAILSRVLLVATPLVVLLAAGVCWWVASSALRPVTAMAAQAEAITVTSSAWQLDIPPATDELSQLAGAFNRLLHRLSAASDAQRQFMADASHELRTPVSVIQTATEVTLERQEREPWEYREALTIVNEQSTRLNRMVEDMLVLARADAGGYQLKPRPVDLDEVVAECVRGVSMVAASRHVALVTEIEPDVSLNADDRLLRQLATNLLTNAVQYTPAGGSVTVAVKNESGGALMTVSDTGPGIPPADRERVFERFVRLDPARSTTSGAGLGLPIARWIAVQHGGTLTVEANAAGGCLFVVRLPAGR